MKPRVKIYQPAKTAMQSGRGKTREWVLEFEPTDALKPDALMGWAGSADTRRQLLLRFPDCKAAVSYAERHGLEYRLMEDHKRRIKPKSYADNFAYGRIQ